MWSTFESRGREEVSFSFKSSSIDDETSRKRKARTYSAGFPNIPPPNPPAADAGATGVVDLERGRREGGELEVSFTPSFSLSSSSYSFTIPSHFISASERSSYSRSRGTEQSSSRSRSRSSRLRGSSKHPSSSSSSEHPSRRRRSWCCRSSSGSTEERSSRGC